VINGSNRKRAGVAGRPLEIIDVAIVPNCRYEHGIGIAGCSAELPDYIEEGLEYPRAVIALPALGTDCLPPVVGIDPLSAINCALL